MAEQLVSEGADLGQLMARLKDTYGPGVRILGSTTIRRGGVMGFFAHEMHRVTFELPRTPSFGDQPMSASVADQPVFRPPAEEPAPPPIAEQPAPPSFAELLAATDAREARLHDAGPVVVPTQARPQSLRPVPTIGSTGRSGASARLDMLIHLREVGVPVGLGPGHGAHSIPQALEEILDELPAPVKPPRQPGEILAMVGELTPALRAARATAAMLRLATSDIAIAGLDNHPITEQLRTEGSAVRVIGNAGAATRLAAELAAGDTVSIVVVATDTIEADPDDQWANEILAALRPTAIWAVLDATRKTEDARAQLGQLGGVDALAVHSAQASGTPASVWDLDLPIALLDGRPATSSVWAALLLGKLAQRDGYRVSA
jgi:hypothetical protein